MPLGEEEVVKVPKARTGSLEVTGLPESQSFLGVGCFQSQIGVFPSRGVSFSQIVFFGSRGVSGSQILVFSVPGLVLSLPSSCVGVFGSQVWAFSVLDNVFPARLLCWCALSRVFFVSFRLNFWLPLPTAGFESTYSCHTIKQTKNTAKLSQNHQSHSL